MGTFLAAVLGIFLAFLGSGMWLAVACALVGMGLLFIMTGWDNMLLSSSFIVWLSTNSFILGSIPLFIFMGFLFMESGLAKRIYASATPLLNHFPGGLLYANIIAGALFAACSGSSVAATATIGSVALPEMEERGYPFSASAGSIGAGGTLATIIPPSVLLIFYASITEQSIGREFMAGVFPGLIMVAMFLIYITLSFRFRGRWREIPRDILPWKTSLAKSKDVWIVLILIVIVLGSIFAGIATPTEAAAVGVAGAVILAVAYRGFNWQVLKRAALGSMTITCQLMFIYIGVKILSAALARAQLISYTTKALITLPVPPLVVLVIVCGIFFLLGMVIESLPMMLMVVPVVYPAMIALGYDPIWFGIVVLLMCHVGNFTPPVGVLIFVIQAIAPDHPVTEIYKGLIPFTIIQLILIVIITAFPQLCLFLPSVMMG